MSKSDPTQPRTTVTISEATTSHPAVAPPTPSLGCIVLFSYYLDSSASPEVATVPAIITKVHNATAVALTVFAPDRGSWAESSAFYSAEPDTAGSWCWPPRA